MNHLRNPETDAEVACLKALREVAGGEGGPIERHGLRVYWIMERLAQRANRAIDEEVSLCAALMHDVGLFVAPRAARLYLHNGRLFAEGILARFGWSSARLTRCLDAIELHHRLIPQWHRGAEVELLRRADLVDASSGAVTAGLDRDDLRILIRALPRTGLYRELAARQWRGLPGHTGALVGLVLELARQAHRRTQARA